MIIQVNVVLRHCRQQQPYSGLRIHPHDHTQPTYEKIQFCYLVCSDEQGVFLGRSSAQGVMFGKVQSFPLRNEFPAFWEFLGILKNS